MTQLPLRLTRLKTTRRESRWGAPAPTCPMAEATSVHETVALSPATAICSP